MTASPNLRRWALLAALPACAASPPPRAAAAPAPPTVRYAAPSAPSPERVVAATFYRERPDQSWHLRGSRGGGQCDAPCWLWVPIDDARFSIEAASLDAPAKSLTIPGERLAYRGGPVTVGLERQSSIGLMAGLIGGGVGAGILGAVVYALYRPCDGFAGIGCIEGAALAGIGGVLVLTGVAIGERTSLAYHVGPASGLASPPRVGAAEAIPPYGR